MRAEKSVTRGRITLTPGRTESADRRKGAGVGNHLSLLLRFG